MFLVASVGTVVTGTLQRSALTIFSHASRYIAGYRKSLRASWSLLKVVAVLANAGSWLPVVVAKASTTAAIVSAKFMQSPNLIVLQEAASVVEMVGSCGI